MSPRVRHSATPVVQQRSQVFFKRGGIAVIALVLVSGCDWIYTEAPFEVKKCMASVDEKFIPALWYSQKGNAEQFSNTMNATIDAWRECRPRFDRFFEDEESTMDVTATVDSLFQTAQSQARAGTLQEAHETLEQVKDIMITARRRQGMTYVLDMLEPLHDTVSVMYKMVTGATDSVRAADLDTAQLDLDTLRNLVESAQRTVLGVVVVRVRPETSSLDSADMDVYSKRLQVLNDTSNELLQAVENRDLEKAVSLVEKMRVTFQRIYLLFGDFTEKPSILKEG